MRQRLPRLPLCLNMFDYTHTSTDTVAALEWLPRERTVQQVAEATLPTEYGTFRLIGYRSLVSDEEFVVLARGEFSAHTPTLVRIHSQCMTGDVFGSLKCDCGQQLRSALKLIAKRGSGVIVYQQQEGRG